MLDARTERRISSRLEELYEHHRSVGDSSVATYYEPGRGYYPPELAGPAQFTFGISLADLDGGIHSAGDHAVPFPMQSVSKIIAYALALADHGTEYVQQWVGVEPSGNAFNSIRLDEQSSRPHNPMVNAGALAIINLIRGRDGQEKVDRVVELTRLLTGNDDLCVDEETFEGEWSTADRNRAIAYLMRSHGLVTGDVEEVLAVYLKQCSIKVTCDDLARMGASLANGCVNPVTGARSTIPVASVRDVLSVMFTCGMYDYAGEWAFDVGVPAKSGVSGGLLAVVPDKLGIGAYSPGLDAHGNSVRGVQVCEEISTRLGLHVFARDEEDAVLGESPPAPVEEVEVPAVEPTASPEINPAWPTAGSER
jgi:glutaminase